MNNRGHKFNKRFVEADMERTLSEDTVLVAGRNGTPAGVMILQTVREPDTGEIVALESSHIFCLASTRASRTFVELVKGGLNAAEEMDVDLVLHAHQYGLSRPGDIERNIRIANCYQTLRGKLIGSSWVVPAGQRRFLKVGLSCVWPRGRKDRKRQGS